MSSASGTLQEYLDQSPYGAQFHDLTPATPAFNAQWQALAQTDPGFGQDQQHFIGQSHYTQQVAALKARGLDLSHRGMAVQDALWSTSVQCRGLTPNIFDKGLQEKFGKHYDLARLSDKDIVSAVQDYKIAHADTLFAGSPKLLKSLKDRFGHEKLALEALADADATMQAQGMTVSHTTLPAAAAPSHAQDVRHPGQSATFMRLHDHGPAVKAFQQQLSALLYSDPDGRPLQADGYFGSNTQSAIKAFQRDQHLHVDGVVGSHTLEALHRAQVSSAVTLDNPMHPGHGMYAQALRVVHDLDAQRGRTPDQLSVNLAGSLAARSREEGMTQINHLVLGDDASQAYAVQGDMNSTLKRYASVDIAQAAAQPLAQSSQAWTQADQQQQQAPNVRQQMAPTMTR